ANDDCAGAIALAVNGDSTCTVVTPGTTAGATESMAAAPCTGTSDDDVWISFVATSTNHQISLLNVVALVGTSTDMFFQVLSGSRGQRSYLVCSDAYSAVLDGSASGDTYFIRVYSVASTSRQTFDICLEIPPAPPFNDDCVKATALVVGGVFS